MDPKKVHVVPFGANHDAGVSEEHLPTLLAERPADRCDLLLPLWQSLRL